MQSLLIAAFFLLLLCVPTAWAQNLPIIYDTALTVEKVASGFDKSSGFDFVGGDILVLEKDKGTIKHLSDDFKIKKYDVLDLNVFDYESDSGLLGITSTAIGNKTYVFLFYTENAEKDGGAQFEYGLGNRVYRYEWNGVGLINPVLVLDLPSAPSPINTGGKITIGPDGQLYTVIGDLNREGKEQNMSNKDPSIYWLYDNKTESSAILRTTLDGKPSSGNLFKEEGFEKFYGYGIRNSFGLAFDPVTGNLWDTEKGPGTLDEINLVKNGFNSGWSQIQGAVSDKCCPDKTLSQNPNNLHIARGSTYADPKLVIRNAPSMTAITFLNSSYLGMNYKNDMFAADMKGNLYHFELDDARENIISSSILATGFGSISDTKTGPDGSLFILTFAESPGFPIGSVSGSLFRITTASESQHSGINQVDADNWGIAGFIAMALTITGIAIYKTKFRRQ